LDTLGSGHDNQPISFILPPITASKSTLNITIYPPKTYV
jgi:hypothetical protein